MSECTHNCSTCGESCAERATPQSLRKAPHPESHIGKVFGVVSGKGGVGKSMVTSQLAVTLHRRGYKVGVMDADITGPSIPQAFGVHDKAVGTQTALYPCVSHSGIEVMSINLLLEDETDPVIWRGPVIGGVVQQFWTDVAWDVDYLFVDMPPGTGDVPLSVFQSIALDGIIVVTSPQELVSMVVEKAVKMAEKMDVPIVGKIWELADPVVSPGYTKGLVGTPNELKLKYLADNDFGDLKGEALKEAIEERIREKTSESLVGNMVSEGTTPRRLTDLIGSLCDLTSGSGDKGTPIVYIQGYFDNYSND